MVSGKLDKYTQNNESRPPFLRECSVIPWELFWSLSQANAAVTLLWQLWKPGFKFSPTVLASFCHSCLCLHSLLPHGRRALLTGRRRQENLSVSELRWSLCHTLLSSLLFSTSLISENHLRPQAIWKQAPCNIWPSSCHVLIPT